jgi:ATP-dependent RNA helicase DDX10/DBP4
MVAPPRPKNQRGKGKERTKQNHELKKQSKRSTHESREIEALQAVIEAGKPEPGTNPLAVAAKQRESTNPTQPAPQTYVTARTFEALPLSQYTKDGLRQAHFKSLTAVQRATLPHALAGRDILGAAKTGSGKTLAFLIPVGSFSFH